MSVLAANLSGKYRKPLSMYYFITYKCPFSCDFCNITGSAQESPELGTDDIKKLLEQMAKAGVIKLQITGGEPMLRDDIAQIVNTAKEFGIFTGISTSGFRIPEKIHDMKNLDLVFLSLEGDKETHDAIRGAGTFDTVKRAMSALKENGIPFWTTSVMNKKSLPSIDFILDWAKEDGFTANFVMLHPRDDDCMSCFADKDKAYEYILDEHEVKQASVKLIEKKKQGFPVGTSPAYLEYISNWNNFKSAYTSEHKGFRCWAGRLYAYMDPYGRMYPCGTLHDRQQGIDVLECGYSDAVAKLEKPDCNACLSACQSEQNMLFSLNAGVIFNWLKALKIKK